jgi:hypothetical protein
MVQIYGFFGQRSGIFAFADFGLPRSLLRLGIPGD